MAVQKVGTIVRSGFLAALAALSLAASATPRGALDAYLARPEPAYAWDQASLRAEPDGSSVQELRMTSQTWQGAPWKHRIDVIRPAGAAHPEFCFLYNTGGNGDAGNTAMGKAVAKATGCTVAILYGIPNQPLYGKSEDALIVYSWRKYVETGDETWPLQFPMVKSVLKAMDAVQASAKAAGQPAVARFLVSGASKRGWTAWLAAASGDRRIAGIAPMVIDMLNMPKQIPHQLAMYGKPSEQIHDYAEGGMLDMLDTPAGKRIVTMVDPYSYRSRLTLPKLIVLGTNDPYWSQDSLNLYWDGLTGPKWVLYLPNNGHGVDDPARLLATLGSFTRALATGEAWPKPSWRWTGTANGATLTVTSDRPIRSARLFRAESATKDFRKSKWSSMEVPVGKGGAAVRMRAPAPRSGYAATFGEVTYAQDGPPFTLSTQVRILGKAAERPGPPIEIDGRERREVR